MNLLKEMHKTQKVNLEFTAKRLRGEVETLARIICINLDCVLRKPEELPITEVDNQFDELKSKWAELNTKLAEIARIEKELS